MRERLARALISRATCRTVRLVRPIRFVASVTQGVRHYSTRRVAPRGKADSGLIRENRKRESSAYAAIGSNLPLQRVSISHSSVLFRRLLISCLRF